MVMAATSSSKSSHSPHLLSHFTPIEEGNEDEFYSQGRNSFRDTTPCESVADMKELVDSTHHHHHPTPLFQQLASETTRVKERSTKKEINAKDDNQGGVLCNKCRPSSREKISVVPLDNNNNNGVNRLSNASPNGIFKSIFSSLMIKRSPRPTDNDSSSTISREEQFKVAVSELSHKLIQATRRRDEAVLEVSRLKYSMTELEKKLNKLEIYCQNLKSNLEACSGGTSTTTSSSKPALSLDYKCIKVGDQDRVIQHFLVEVSEARSSIRLLSRSLTLQLRQIGGKVYDRIALLLQPYEIKISVSRNPRGLIFYLEALLNKAFFEDFESSGFQKSSSNEILNPIDRCEANFASFSRLHGLTWEEVLEKGTRHFSEEFSKFCDRKMSEIVAMLGWSRAWPEQLLQTFFGASKAVWLVHLLANSVHPGLPIFRVDMGVRFDPVYMEDMGGDKARKLVPTIVRIMVTPGFYVYDNVVKCKVLCRYYHSVYTSVSNETPLITTPSPT